METILGLIMFYSWIHGTAIVFKKIKGLTQYEKVVLWVGLVSLVMLVIGVVAE